MNEIFRKYYSTVQIHVINFFLYIFYIFNVFFPFKTKTIAITTKDFVIFYLNDDFYYYFIYLKLTLKLSGITSAFVLFFIICKLGMKKKVSRNKFE